ncbi:MAG: competence/damage-inducible protein A [Pseudomonadota bacterium]
MTSDIVTAAMLAIGDELLSGRTKDRNIAYLADLLTVAGIELKEVRIVGDEEADIVEALNALRERYDYVFTSGGIGPTHDDITADAVAVAFEVSIDHDPRAMKLLSENYASRDLEFTEARKRMARIPDGADLIENPVSVAPGFRLDNVHVMAGVPSIFQAMLDSVLPTLRTGTKILALSVDSPFPEGTIGAPLGVIQKAHPGTAIGSYPKFDGKTYSTQIVVRSKDQEKAQTALDAVHAMLDELSNG